MICIFGLFHGLILLPVVLCLLGPIENEDEKVRLARIQIIISFKQFGEKYNSLRRLGRMQLRLPTPRNRLTISSNHQLTNLATTIISNQSTRPATTTMSNQSTNLRTTTISKQPTSSWKLPSNSWSQVTRWNLRWQWKMSTTRCQQEIALVEILRTS